MTNYYLNLDIKPEFISPEERKAVYESVFGSEAGRRVLKDILYCNGFYNLSFNGDINQTLLNEGMKVVCRHIVNMLNAKITKPEGNTYG